MAEAAVFEGLNINDDEEGMPKRIVAGRESIPNPFVDAVKATYDAWKADPKNATTKSFTVPVGKKETGKAMTLRTQTRKDKDGKVADVTQWQGHPNVTSALYMLRQAAEQHNIGVRILVDYKDTKVNGVAVPIKDKDGKETGDVETYDDVTRKVFNVTDGKVRIRFIGQPKKQVKKGDDASDTSANDGVRTDTTNAA